MRARRGADQVDIGVAQRLGDPAPDDDDLGSEDVDQATQSHAQKVGGEAFLSIVSVVIGFWFSQRQATKNETPPRPTDGAPR